MRKLFIAIIATIFGFSLGAQQASAELSSKLDDFTGNYTHKTSDLDVKRELSKKERRRLEKKRSRNGGFVNRKTKENNKYKYAGFRLELTKAFSGKAKASYSAKIIYSYEFDDFNFEHKNSLQFSVDGKVYSFDRDGDVGEEAGIGILRTRKTMIAKYHDIPEELVKKLANGEDVKVRIVGYDRSLTGQLLVDEKSEIGELLAAKNKA